jgi:hypothetical protein
LDQPEEESAMRVLLERPALLAVLAGLLCGLAWTVSPASAGGAAGLKVKEGQPAPDVELPATQVGSVLPDKKGAKMLHLSDFKGKKNVVLYFYPKALTGG